MRLTQEQLREHVRYMIQEHNTESMALFAKDRIITEGLIAESSDKELKKEIPDLLDDVKAAKEKGEDPKEVVKKALEDMGLDLDLDAMEKVIAKENIIRNGQLIENKRILKEGLSIFLILGVVLAAPKIIELFVDLVSYLKGFKKYVDDHGHERVDNEFMDKLLQFAHKAHKTFLKGTGSLFSKGYRTYKLMTLDFSAAYAGPPDELKELWAERTLMLIVACLAVYSGVGAISAFKKYQLGFAALETGMAGVKSFEIAQYVGGVGEVVEVVGGFLPLLMNPKIIKDIFTALFARGSLG